MSNQTLRGSRVVLLLLRKALGGIHGKSYAAVMRLFTVGRDESEFVWLCEFGRNLKCMEVCSGRSFEGYGYCINVEEGGWIKGISW